MSIRPELMAMDASRVDYSISDNTKLFVRYNLQKERQLFPVGLWWRNGDQVPYPTPIVGKNESQSVSASLTHVFSPTMTNESVFGYTYIDFPNVFDDPSKVDRTQLDIPVYGSLPERRETDSVLEFRGRDWQASSIPAGSKRAEVRAFSRTSICRQSATTSRKYGERIPRNSASYYEYVINDQPANSYTNGSINESVGNPNSTGNVYADLLTGQTSRPQRSEFQSIFITKPITRWNSSRRTAGR